MNRRAFIKLTGGLFGVAMLSPLANHPEIDLSIFCDEFYGEGSRWRLDKPFSQDERVIATDSRILVTVNSSSCEIAESTARVPSVSHLPLGEGGLWRPWPKPGLINDMRPNNKWGNYHLCPMCDGKGRVGDSVRECEHQNGKWDECAVDCFKCPDCHMTEYVGGVACDYCNGTGETDRPCIQPVGDMLIAGNYDRRVRTLPDVVFREVAFTNGRYGVNEGIAFRFAGGEGLVMPLSLERQQL